MSKAEERALKVYPPKYKEPKRGAKRIQSEKVDTHQPLRTIFIRAYEQAEKDLGWISVEDELPSTLEYVYTCVKLDNTPQCVGLNFYKDGKWWDGFDEEYDGTIEYWMPIPNFPKK